MTEDEGANLSAALSSIADQSLELSKLENIKAECGELVQYVRSTEEARARDIASKFCSYLTRERRHRDADPGQDRRARPRFCPGRRCGPLLLRLRSRKRSSVCPMHGLKRPG